MARAGCGWAGTHPPRATASRGCAASTPAGGTGWGLGVKPGAGGWHGRQGGGAGERDPRAQRQALAILDWPHLARALHTAIRAGRRAFHQTLGELAWQGEIEALEQGLAALRTPGEEVAALEGALRYLASQREWLGNYGEWQASGYPIGSGAVERGVEVVINRRLAGRGRRSRRANADAVLALRVEDLNTAWDRSHEPRLYSA